jgi:hypothetical protein
VANSNRGCGEESRCPTCWWEIDSEAYYCPKCQTYFCSECLAQISKSEEQYQCWNQSCVCYGKPVCDVCSHGTRVATKPKESRMRPSFGLVCIISIFAMLCHVHYCFVARGTRSAFIALVVEITILLSAAMMVALFNSTGAEENYPNAPSRLCIRCG